MTSISKLLEVFFGPTMATSVIAGVVLIAYDGWRWYAAKVSGEWNDRSTTFFGLVGLALIISGLLGSVIALCDAPQKTEGGSGDAKVR